MKTSDTLSFLTLVMLSAAPAGAAVLLPSTDHTVAIGPAGAVSLSPITTAQLAGQTHLVIDFHVTRLNTDAGDSWFAIGANADATLGGGDYVNSGDFATLIRTRTDVSVGHQTFGVGSASWSPSATASPVTATGTAVRLILDVTNGLTGTSALQLLIDENATDFVSADVTATGTITWGADLDEVVFSLFSHVQGHQVSDLTITTIPEPSSLVLLSLGLLGLSRRKRSVN